MVWTVIARFLTSRFSGWLSIVAVIATLMLGGATTTLVWKYKDLQARAAYCEGKTDALESARTYQDLAIDLMREDTKEIIDEIEKLKALPGCASELPPDSVLDRLRPQ